MLKYIFSISLFFGVITTSFSQKKATTDTIKQRFGIRFGIDLNRLTRSIYDKNYKGLELQTDYRITKKIYFAGEIGNENKTTITDNFNFTNKGTYFKLGIDYNAYDNWLDMENMVYTGLRVGASSYSQTINTFNINEPPTYYGLNTVIDNDKTDGLNAIWLEALTGIKAKVYNNIFLGFSVRLHYLVNQNKPAIEDVYYIPGFNSVTENNKFGASFNYTISYLIPLYKKKPKLLPVKVDKKN